MAYATLADLQARYPQEIILLGADEATGLLDEARVIAALSDASIEVTAILQGRYDAAALANLTAESRAILSLYTQDIALYRVALSFARSTDAIKERAQAAIKRLEAIAAGKGALEVAGQSPAGAGTGVETSTGGAAMVAREKFWGARW